jgi:hypothetical protein
MGTKKFDHIKLSEQLNQLKHTHTMKEAGKLLGLTRGQVSYICTSNGISFRPEGKPNWNQILEESDIPIIRQLIAEGFKTKVIASKFDCTTDLIRSIKSGRAWGHVQ